MYFLIFFLVTSLITLTSFEAYAGTAIQTDWSGGDGIFGPVVDWGNEYFADMNMSCNNLSDLVLLPLEHTVDGAFYYAQSVYSSDVNGDGYIDILGGAGVDAITWWENVDGTGTSWTEHTIKGNVNWTFSIYSADVNGDGYMDVLGAAGDSITWWENIDGSGINWTEHTIDGDFDSARSVYSADVNGDGCMDVLGASAWDDDITWWENLDGTGTSWTEHTVDGDFDGARSVYSADVNGDGYMDVLGAANVADDITWWENLDGTGTSWTEHTVDGDFDGARSVYSADVNGDGYMDVLGAANVADDITWWENLDGTGTSWTEHTVDGGFYEARSVYSADVNGDGYMDVLGAAQSADAITWWDLTGFLPDGSLESSVLDIQESPDWQTIDWTCIEPAGTGVALQVRSSDNSSNMGEWSDTLTTSCTLEGILTDEDLYFQYRAILTTTDSLSTPVLQDVTVAWLPYIGTEEAEGASFVLHGARPNPILGTAVLVFTMLVDSGVKLTVYDLTGRVVHSINGEYEPGVYEVILDGLASGVYLIRMTSEEFTATQQFVVIE
ncbi:MAG: T9SS type A sorting domain-containing protein [Candidatus Aegiribacteria sp.]|nr:T9SS type A sorting domain-containing protein [Candidatus Aegiribacteria sp.]